MTTEEAIAILENEKECVNRANKNDYCNRDCYNCELVKTDTEILTALEMAISALSENKGEWIAQDIHNCHTNFKCSKCGYIHSFMHLYGKPTADYTYCPNCGAKMKGGE